MPIENGEWIMRGRSRRDPARIRTAEELTQYVERVGFLPLFAGDIRGFSAEEQVCAEDWWCGDPSIDPWSWRERIARAGVVAYGKFFGGRAGFISRAWFPFFANYRRDGYDFDARWDDELATLRAKKIMDCFDSQDELFSFELKRLAGFGKNGEKNFDGTVAALQAQTYLVIRDFRCRRRKADNVEYGWPIAVYATPEKLWDYDTVTACYREDPQKSFERLYQHVHELYPDADDAAIRKILK